MRVGDALRFGAFKLAGGGGPLYRDGVEVALRQKSLSLLNVLIENAGKAVSKEMLLDVVWPDQATGDGNLAVCIGEIRKALDDDPQSPRFIQTVHKFGYRFIGRVVSESEPWHSSNFVGRDAQLDSLATHFQLARHGNRQFVQIVGEAGFGKTTLIETWSNALIASAEALVLSASCSKQIGHEVPYAPFLQMLQDLLAGPEAERSQETLSRLAPSWMFQMSLKHGETEPKQSAASDAGRLQRELETVLLALAVDRPLVLVLEDLHWCDPASAAFLATLGRMKSAAKLMIVVSHRPAGSTSTTYPIQTVLAELEVVKLSSVLRLGPLSREEVGTLVDLRFGPHVRLGIKKAVYHRTEGHPLFLTALLDHLEQKGIDTLNLISVAELSNLVAFISLRFEDLSNTERGVVEAASTAGTEFAAAALEDAVAADSNSNLIEDICNRLARRGAFVEAVGSETWPDGTLTGTYRFRHSLYPEVVRNLLEPARLSRLNLAIANRLARGYQDETAPIAARLFHHFAEGRNPARAVPHALVAAQTASLRHAHQEATELLVQARDLLEEIVSDDIRLPLELQVLLALGPLQVATHGYSSDAVAQTFRRALDLSHVASLSDARFPILRGLGGLHIMRADYQAAAGLGQDLLKLEPDLVPISDGQLVEGHLISGIAAFFRGRLTESKRAFETLAKLYNLGEHLDLAGDHGADPLVLAQGHSTLIAWMAGSPKRSRQREDQLLDHAKEVGHKFSLCQAYSFAALLGQLREDLEQVRHYSGMAADLAKSYGFAFITAAETARTGWMLVRAGGAARGIQKIREGAEMYAETGAVGGLTAIQSTLAEAYLFAGEYSLGLAVADEALVSARMHGEGFFHAELLRLKGALLAPTDPAQAENYYRAGLDMAGQQEARCWEVRIAQSLSELLTAHGREEEASELIALTRSSPRPYDAYLTRSRE